MTATLVGTLVGMAVIDSTSFGTLGVPVWMLAQQRVRVAAVLTYLAAISGFYWLLGVVLLVGASRLQDTLAALETNQAAQWAQLVVGVALFAATLLFSASRAERRRTRRGGAPTRRDRWRERVVGPEATLGGVTTVALLAGLIEAASMLPYLAAIGMLTASGLTVPAQLAVLAGYVLVMTLPAGLLLTGRVTGRQRLEPVLARLARWIQRNSDAILGWVLGIVGFLLVVDAAQALDLWPLSLVPDDGGGWSGQSGG